MTLIQALSAHHYKRSGGKKRAVRLSPLNIITRVSLLGCAVLSLWLLSQYAQNMLQISSITLNVQRAQVAVDSSHYRIDTAQLQKILPATLGDSLWQLDLSAIREQILTLPWVRDATVHIILPNTLQLDIQEHVPVAIQVDAKGNAMLLAQDGTPIAPPTTADTQLPHVFGAGSERIVRPSEQYLLQAAQEFNVKTFVRVGQRRWSLLLNNGITVRLPEENPAAALEQLHTLQQRYNLLDREIKMVDLRTPNRVYVQLASSALTAPVAQDKK